MFQPSYTPPLLLRKGLTMTLYTAFRSGKTWHKTLIEPEPLYQKQIFRGFQDVPIFGLVAIPSNPKGTIIGTYGITGDLDNQWFLKILGRKAFARGYAVILFDWRAHGKTARLSPTLTSDGLYEGKDFVYIAAQGKQLGCPAPFWFTGYSLGGQLALWGIKEGENLDYDGHNLGLQATEIGGGAVICPSLDSHRSLTYLMNDIFGKYIERAIAKNLKQLAWQIYQYHPEAIDPEAIERANSIRGFDRELVIKSLGFSCVKDYYNASSPLPFLGNIDKPTLIIYAADDPMFDPAIVPDLQDICQHNSAIDLMLTRYGGHVGYISSYSCQRRRKDADPWWAWNRVLEWVER